MSPEFETYVDRVIARHFEGMPKPDGTCETNREHIRRKGAACDEIAREVEKIESDPRAAWEMNYYAEGKAQSAIYALFGRTPITKSPRLKGMKGDGINDETG